MKRSIVFIHNSFYHFYYLAQALRKRGWDALSVSIEDPENSPNSPLYHGEDLNLFSPDPEKLRKNIEVFFENALERFQMLHFAGDGLMSCFPEYWQQWEAPDIVEWLAKGKRLGYTISGCTSCISNEAFSTWNAKAGRLTCDVCSYRGQYVCNMKTTMEWARKTDAFCDLISAETMPAIEYLDSPKVYREPLTMCLDPEIWKPGLEIPEKYRIEKAPEALFVYHAVANHDKRTLNGKNIKGTGALAAAVDKLKEEGFNCRLIFKTGVSSREIRYFQAQADVLVAQLNFGRYGATARESMMLGIPTVCCINNFEYYPEAELQSLKELPLVNADEKSIYSVLKKLLSNEDERKKLGEDCRQYALKWHSADACAERYEKIYDSLFENPSAERKTREKYFQHRFAHRGFRNYKNELINVPYKLYSIKKNRIIHKVNEIKEAGFSKLAFYGGGKHTKEAMPFEDLPLMPICIIDDNSISDQMGGIPVSKLNDIARFDIDSILISSDAHEENMYKKAVEKVNSKMEVFKIYS